MRRETRLDKHGVQSMHEPVQASGFGVTVAISVSSLALYRMTEAAVWYVKLRGATCGTGRMLVANDFFFSGFLMTFAFIGYAIACNLAVWNHGCPLRLRIWSGGVALPTLCRDALGVSSNFAHGPVLRTD
jgi:hypothetical protein